MADVNKRINILARFKLDGLNQLFNDTGKLEKQMNSMSKTISQRMIEPNKRFQQLSKNYEKLNSLGDEKLGIQQNILSLRDAMVNSTDDQKKAINENISALNRRVKALSLEETAMRRVISVQNTNSKNITRFDKEQQKIAESTFIESWADRFNVSGKRIKSIMNDQDIHITRAGKAVDRFDREIVNLNSSMKTGLRNTKRFKFEFLGVLFAGMALQRAMNGLMRTSLEWTGVMEILSDALGILFLPIALVLLDWAVAFLDWVSNMPEGVQLFIGALVLLGSALGLIMIVGAQIAGFFSTVFGMTFPQLISGAITWLGSLVSLGFLPVLAIAAAVIAIVIGIYLAFKENFMGMKTIISTFIDGFKGAFNGLLTFFGGIWNIIKGIFTGNADLIISGLKSVILGLFEWMKGSFKVALSAIAAVIVGAIRVVLGILQSTINLWIASYDKISKLVGGKGTSFRVDLIGSLSMPSFKTGGIMPYTGVAYLHKGEKIIPTNEINKTNNNQGPTNFYISANVSNDYDVNKLANQLKRYWSKDFERSAMARN